MPRVEQFAPGAVRALARCATLAADDEAVLEQLAADADARLRVSAAALDARQLAALPPAVARRVVRRFAARTGHGAAWSARHLEAVLKLAAAADCPEARRLDLPGANVERRGNVITFGPAAIPEAPAGFDRPLPVPGSTDIPEAGARIEAHWLDNGTPPPPSNRMMAALDARALALPLRVRSRLPGDRLKPPGAPGRRKLQDLFVDRRVPREARDRVPLVVDAAGRIVWVAGLTVAEGCGATTTGGSMVILELINR
jgi:tRNA(Ile)-lysidine synthase